MQKLTSKDWVRMLIAFLLGVAVTLLVIQLTGGQLFQGYFDVSRDLLEIEETIREEEPVRGTIEEDPVTDIIYTEEPERSSEILDTSIREKEPVRGTIEEDPVTDIIYTEEPERSSEILDTSIREEEPVRGTAETEMTFTEETVVEEEGETTSGMTFTEEEEKDGSED
jgi:hypothetical protein